MAMKTLVVDDENVSREKMGRIMRCYGACQEVQSGAESIEAFTAAWKKKDPFTLITLDISMAEMNGMDALKQIRELEKTMKLPVEKKAIIFMVTVDAARETIVNCIGAGCNDYIVKPFNRETLKIKMAKWFPGIEPID